MSGNSYNLRFQTETSTQQFQAVVRAAICRTVICGTGTHNQCQTTIEITPITTVKITHIKTDQDRSFLKSKNAGLFYFAAGLFPRTGLLPVF